MYSYLSVVISLLFSPLIDQIQSTSVKKKKKKATILLSAIICHIFLIYWVRIKIIIIIYLFNNSLICLVHSNRKQQLWTKANIGLWCGSILKDESLPRPKRALKIQEIKLVEWPCMKCGSSVDWNHWKGHEIGALLLYQVHSWIIQPIKSVFFCSRFPGSKMTTVNIKPTACFMWSSWRHLIIFLAVWSSAFLFVIFFNPHVWTHRHDDFVTIYLPCEQTNALYSRKHVILRSEQNHYRRIRRACLVNF